MSRPTLAGDAVAHHGGSGRLAPGVRPPLSRMERVSSAIAYHHRVYLRTWRPGEPCSEAKWWDSWSLAGDTVPPP